MVRWLAVTQILLWLLACGAWFYIRTAAYLAHSIDDDLYAHTWAFQAINFCISRLPFALPCHMRNSLQAAWGLFDLIFAIAILAFGMGTGWAIGTVVAWLFGKSWGGIGFVVGFVLGIVFFHKLPRLIFRRSERKPPDRFPATRDKS
jgi:hypothetical protein